MCGFIAGLIELMVLERLWEEYCDSLLHLSCGVGEVISTCEMHIHKLFLTTLSLVVAIYLVGLP